MILVLTVTILLLLTSPLHAHPGKTDHYGGHKCWRNCEEWELLRGEYHLHDEDGNPVFTDRKEKEVKPEEPKGVPDPDKRFLMEEASGIPAGHQEGRKPDTQIQPLPPSKQTVTVYEESLLPVNYILLLLLVLLLMVLIFVRNKREKG